MLFKQSLIIHKKLISISIAGLTGGLFGILVLLHSMSHFRNWSDKQYMVTFWIMFFILGIIYLSQSFPAFRSKEKTMAFLMLPASSFEKYIFELLTRIVAFIIIMPTLFWTIVYIETSVIHYINPEFLIYKFSFNKVLLNFSIITNNHMPMQKEWLMFAKVQWLIIPFITIFCGASHFSKSPLIKTFLTMSLIMAGYSLLMYLLSKGLRIEAYNLVKTNRNFQSLPYLLIILSFFNLSILVIAWFKLKEKET